MPMTCAFLNDLKTVDFIGSPGLSRRLHVCALTMEQRLAFRKNITGRASTTRWRAEADTLAARGSPCRKGAIFFILELDQPFRGLLVVQY